MDMLYQGINAMKMIIYLKFRITKMAIVDLHNKINYMFLEQKRETCYRFDKYIEKQT